MPDDRGQHVIEIVGDATGELPHGAHLGRLLDLALQPAFLAIVLQAQQHGGIAQAARASDGQRDGLVRMVLQPNRHVGDVRCSIGEPSDRVGNGRLVLTHDQIARINRRIGGIDLGGARKGIVHLNEPAVTIDQRHAERQQRYKAFDRLRRARAASHRLLVVDQRHQQRRIVTFKKRDLQDAQRRAGQTFALEPHQSPRIGDEKAREIASRDRTFLMAHRSSAKNAIGGTNAPIGGNQGDHDAGRGQSVAMPCSDQLGCAGGEIEALRAGKAPDQHILLGAGANDIGGKRGSAREHSIQSPTAIAPRRATCIGQGSDAFFAKGQPRRRRKTVEQGFVAVVGANEATGAIGYRDRIGACLRQRMGDRPIDRMLFRGGRSGSEPPPRQDDPEKHHRGREKAC